MGTEGGLSYETAMNLPIAKLKFLCSELEKVNKEIDNKIKKGR